MANQLSAEELQRQIEQLERELNEAKLKVTQVPTQAQTQASTISPVRSTTPTKKWSSSASPTRTQQQQQPPAAPAIDDPIRARAVQSKQHGWEKPAWAIPTDAIGGDDAIVTDPIQNGLKQASTGGYERKVFDKELAIVPGTFKKPSGTLQVKKEDLRLVWIVVNINGSKAGKIVMHLYGNVEAIVDKFIELKGLEIKRKVGSTDLFYVDDIEPHFYINAEPVIAKSQLDSNKDCVFGHVQEGHEIVTQMIQCDPSNTVYTVKQSHIFPVKKTRM